MKIKGENFSIDDIRTNVIAAIAAAKDLQVFTHKYLAHLFLKEFVPDALKEVSLLYIRQCYCSLVKEEHVPTEEDDFYKHINRQHLKIEQAPRDMLLEFYTISTVDLQAIAKHISYIQGKEDELEKLNEKNDVWLNGAQRYEQKKLAYYKDKNQKAKAEIVDFITNKIHEEVKKCFLYDLFLEPITGFSCIKKTLPYKYPGVVRIGEYDITQLTAISNKFGHLGIGDFELVKSLYKEDKPQFYDVAHDHILNGDGGVITRINQFIEAHHIINGKAEVIKTIVNHYQNDDYLSVVHMLPLQIEGIFHDICLAMGINESQIDVASINDKVKIVKQESSFFLYFEYYAFIFPIFRNRIAHGKLVTGDLKHHAIMLMLDLLPVCDFAASKEIKVNLKVDLVREFESSNDKECLIKLLDYYDVDLPEFYKLENSYQKLLAEYCSDEFWRFVIEKVKKEDVNKLNDSEIFKFIKKLRKTSLAKKNCIDFFDKFEGIRTEMKEKSTKDRAVLERLLSGLTQK